MQKEGEEIPGFGFPSYPSNDSANQLVNQSPISQSPVPISLFFTGHWSPITSSLPLNCRLSSSFADKPSSAATGHPEGTVFAGFADPGADAADIRVSPARTDTSVLPTLPDISPVRLQRPAECFEWH
jgi:hypothetical protein